MPTPTPTPTPMPVMIFLAPEQARAQVQAQALALGQLPVLTQQLEQPPAQRSQPPLRQTQNLPPPYAQQQLDQHPPQDDFPTMSHTYICCTLFTAPGGRRFQPTAAPGRHIGRQPPCTQTSTPGPPPHRVTAQK